MTKAKRLAARELKLVVELQNNHDWMFSELPKKNDRHTMYFKRSVVKGKTTQVIKAARRIVVAFPATSTIALAFDARAKAGAPTKHKRGAK